MFFGTALYGMKECCIDKPMTAKVRAMAADADALRTKHSLLSALQTWSHVKRLCNMSLERLFALFRSGAAAATVM